MIILVKDIEVYFKKNDLVITTNSKLDFKETLLEKELLKKDIQEEFVNVFINNKNLSFITYTNDLELDYYHFIPDNFETVTIIEEVTEEIIDEDGNTEEVTEEITEEVSVELHDFNFNLSLGWSYFSVPLDLTNIIKTNSNNEDVLTDYTSLGIDILLQDCLYEYEEDSQPLFYKNESRYQHLVYMVKNNIGQIYKPAWMFNGIGNTNQWEGYQIRLEEPLIFKAKGKILEGISKLSDYDYTYPNGWNLFAFKSLSADITPVAFASDYADANQFTIIKDVYGSVYIPQYSFNGIGYLTPGMAYQIKFQY